MTLIEIRNQLFSHFLKTDTFILSDHLSKVKVGKNQLEIKEQLIASALDDMVKSGACNKIVAGEKIAYVLAVPLGVENRDLTISSHTAEMVANVIEQFCEATGEDGILIDKTAICDADIANLCMICAQLLNSFDDEELEEDDDE